MGYKISKIKITFPNGKINTFAICEFEHFASVNELEHKECNIIINLTQIKNSFIYDINDNDEIINKEFIPSVTFIKEEL